MKKLEFRDDISGLRAIAVLPVLMFHANHPWFTGGFLGVDVFFVISGYLISTIIIFQVHSQTFSFLKFYERRIRRILPALMFLIFAVSIMSFFFMLPYDLKNYGQSLFATIISANNVLLYMTSGYWAASAEFKPLYHTWSLGIEEQYYFITPIVLFFIVKFVKSSIARITLMVSLLLISFIYSYQIADNEFNFLMIVTRAWELLAGAVIAFIMLKSPPKKNQILSLIGLALICISYINPYLFSHNQAISNLPVVIGAMLIIVYAKEHETFVGKLLSLKLFVFIGLISYSFYLWHQPILAFLRLSSETNPSYMKQVFYSLLSIPIGYLSWRFVENIFRSKQTIRNGLFYPGLICATIVFAGLGLIMHKTYGFNKYWPRYAYGGNPQSYVDKTRSFKKDIFDSKNRKNFLVVGNSFARDFLNMVSENGITEKYNFVYLEWDTSSACTEKNTKDLNALVKRSHHVIYAGSWGQTYFDIKDVDKVSECYSLMKSWGEANIYVLGVKNFGWNNNFIKMIKDHEVLAYKVTPLVGVIKFNKLAKEKIGPDFIDLLEILSLSGKVPLFADDGRFITYDTNHLTKSGAKFVGSTLFTNSLLSKLLD